MPEGSAAQRRQLNPTEQYGAQGSVRVEFCPGKQRQWRVWVCMPLLGKETSCPQSYLRQAIRVLILGRARAALRQVNNNWTEAPGQRRRLAASPSEGTFLKTAEEEIKGLRERRLQQRCSRDRLAGGCLGPPSGPRLGNPEVWMKSSPQTQGGNEARINQQPGGRTAGAKLSRSARVSCWLGLIGAEGKPPLQENGLPAEREH